MRLKCPEFWQPSRQASRRRDPRESGTLVVKRGKTRGRGARASRALTGLMGFFDGITWASARRTRSSPGFHIRGLQPPGGLRPAVPLRAGHRPAPYLKLRARLRPRPPQWLCYGGWTAPTWTGVSLLRQRAEIRGQRSESGCGFDPQDVGGEMLMSRDCPGKAPPCTHLAGRCARQSVGGGCRRGGLKHDERPWGLRQGLNVKNDEFVGMRKPPESGGFVLEDIGGEMVMARDCPEFGRGAGGGGRGVKAPEGWRSPRPGGLRGGLGHDENPWGLHRSVSQVDRGVVRMRRIVESRGEFVLEDTRSGGGALTGLINVWGGVTQGVARGLALPWANEWLRLWREEGIGSSWDGKGVERGRWEVIGDQRTGIQRCSVRNVGIIRVDDMEGRFRFTRC